MQLVHTCNNVVQYQEKRMVKETNIISGVQLDIKEVNKYLQKQQWAEQWRIFKNNTDINMFQDWIKPYTFNDFKNKVVIDLGCGNGQHLNILSSYIKSGVGIDKYSYQTATDNNKHNDNISIFNKDINEFHSKRKYDITYSIGVIHHTPDPDITFNNIKKSIKKGCTLIIMIYSSEGNIMNRMLVETFKGLFEIHKLKHKEKLGLSKMFTYMINVAAKTIYRLNMKFMPFNSYIQQWNTLSFERNTLNIYDKLNAPITHYITKDTINEWFKGFDDVNIRHHMNVCWCVSGVKN